MSTGLPPGKVFWIDASARKIQSAHLDGSHVEDVVTGLSTPLGLAVDSTACKIYWVDAGTNKICRANLDGSDVEDIVSDLDSPSGSSLGLVAGKVYWIDRMQKKIFRANHGESGLQVGSELEAVAAELKSPNAITVDPISRKLYWGDFGTKKIHRANLDGSAQENVVAYGRNSSGVAVDPLGSKVYWANFGTKCIFRCNLNGSDMEYIVSGLQNPNGIALDLKSRKVYWVDRDARKIQRASFDGSDVEDVLTDLGNPWGIAVLPGPQPQAFDPPPRSVEPEAGPDAVPGGEASTETAATSTVTAIETSKAAQAPEDTELPVISIARYQWGDEEKNVKIYIDASKEEGAVQAAGDGKNDEVVVDFRPTAFTLTVKGKVASYVLRMTGLFGEIIPEKCRFRVSAGKKITVTLVKKEEEAWRGLAQKT